MNTPLMNNGTILLTSKTTIATAITLKTRNNCCRVSFKSALISSLVAYAYCHFLAAETNRYQPIYSWIFFLDIGFPSL